MHHIRFVWIIRKFVFIPYMSYFSYTGVDSVTSVKISQPQN